MSFFKTVQTELCRPVYIPALIPEILPALEVRLLCHNRHPQYASLLSTLYCLINTSPNSPGLFFTFIFLNLRTLIKLSLGHLGSNYFVESSKSHLSLVHIQVIPVCKVSVSVLFWSYYPWDCFSPVLSVLFWGQRMHTFCWWCQQQQKKPPSPWLLFSSSYSSSRTNVSTPLTPSSLSSSSYQLFDCWWLF